MRTTRGWLVGGLAVVVGLAVVGAVIHVAREERANPARCAEGFVPMGARCCAPGQRLDRGHCVGAPYACPEGMHRVDGSRPGCALNAERVAFAAGALSLGPSDWEAEGVVSRQRVELPAFAIDNGEVTEERFYECARAGVCGARDFVEPGQPVTGVGFEEASRYCSWVGGQLPSEHQWLRGAAGEHGRRFPWGQTGLVCRRAAYGLLRGPCASGGTEPELVGSRPDGATPEGVLDLAGNVAEWTRGETGEHGLRGGGFAARVAGDLKSWALSDAALDPRQIGFRCAYDAAPLADAGAPPKAE